MLSVNPEGTKPLDIGHVNKEYSNKLHKKHINNICIKFKYAKTVKDISRKFKYTGNKRRLQISLMIKAPMEKDRYKWIYLSVKLTHITIWQIYILYTHNLKFNKDC